MTERPGPRGLRIWFRPEPGAEKGLRALVAVETGCCPWGTWAVQTGPGHIVLGVRLASAGIVALRGWSRRDPDRGTLPTACAAGCPGRGGCAAWRVTRWGSGANGRYELAGSTAGQRWSAAWPRTRRRPGRRG